MPSTTNVAIIGCGDIAQTAHLPAWAQDDRAQVTCVVDVDADVARATAERWSVPRWGTDYRDALADDVDALDVCLPGRLHVDSVVDGLAAGKHVLVEKPVALTLEHAQRMAEAQAVAPGLVLMVAENWPYSSAYLAAEEALTADRIGEPFLLQSSHHSDLRLARARGSGKGDRDYAGYFFAAGIHTVNLSREIMGPVREVHAYARGGAGLGELPLDDEMVAVLHFERGGIGTLDLSGRSRHVGPRRLEFRVLGEKGVLEFDIWAGWTRVTSGDAVTHVLPRQPSVGYAEETSHFLDCVQDGVSCRTGIDGQLETLATVFAGYRSLESGSPVRPADVLDALSRAGGAA